LKKSINPVEHLIFLCLALLDQFPLYFLDRCIGRRREELRLCRGSLLEFSVIKKPVIGLDLLDERAPGSREGYRLPVPRARPGLP